MTDEQPTPTPTAEPDPGPGPWISTDPDGKATGTVFHTDLTCRGLVNRVAGNGVSTVDQSIIRVLGYNECGTCVRTKQLRTDPQLTAIARSLNDIHLVKIASEDDVRDALVKADGFRKALNGLGFDVTARTPQ